MTAQTFGNGGSGTTTTKEVANEVAFIATSFNDAFEKLFWFLSSISCIFRRYGRSCILRPYITPNICY